MHTVLYVLAAVAAIFLVFLLTAVITDYRPAEREMLQDRSGLSSDTAEVLPDSLSILCWNIGYGGLGDDMDFFYDGGTQVRTSRERTQANIDGIIAEIRRHSPDIILLQEVDECSRRTYRINEVEMLRVAFPDYHIYLAYNYKSFFVPIPVKAPMGRVASGVVLMSRIAPEEVVRWQYPSRFPWPVSMFNLKRCLRHRKHPQHRLRHRRYAHRRDPLAGRTDRPSRLGRHPLHHRRRLEPVSARVHTWPRRDIQSAFYHRGP